MKPDGVKVSVIMAAYNAERFIDRAIRSVLSQKGVSFELLIGDDASKDQTWSRMKVYQEDPRVRVFRVRLNRGAAAMRNLLLDRAVGKYISTCDADDLMLSGNLQRLSKRLDKDSKLGVIYGDLLVKSSRGSSWIKHRFIPEKSWDLLGGCFANGGTLIRRSLIKKAGGYRPKFRFLEDCDLLLRLSELTKFYYLPGKPLYVQTKTPDSLSDQPRGRLRKASQTILRNAIQRRYGYRIKW